jgi:hypothetical protein
MADTVEEVVTGAEAEAPVVEAGDAPEVEAPPDSEFAAATEEVAPVEEETVANNKRKFEETDGAAEEDQAHIRKRGSFEDVDPEPAAPVVSALIAPSMQLFLALQDVCQSSLFQGGVLNLGLLGV